MPKIITLASQKGGTGKSTICMCLYHSFLKYSSKITVCIVDLDPQQSIANLVEIQSLSIDVYDNLEAEKLNDYSIVLVDTPPRLTEDQNDIYGKSDLILIPSKTGIFDVVSTIQAFSTIGSFAPNTKKFVVLNQINTTTKLNDKVLTEFSKNGVEVFKSTIGNRLAFQHAMYQNGNIFKTKNQKAKEESTALATETYSNLI